MIRLVHRAGSQQGAAYTAGHGPVTLGRAPGCDVRFDAERDTLVSANHAQVVNEGSDWVLVDAHSTNGTWLNGERVHGRAPLRSGDRIRLGGLDGPELEVLIERTGAVPVPAPTVERPVPTAAAGDVTAHAEAMAQSLAARLRRGLRASLALPALGPGAERALEGGHTVTLVRQAMRELAESVRLDTRRRWVRVVAGVAGLALVVLAGMGAVIWVQHREIRALLATKAELDTEIRRVDLAMQAEEDPARLEALGNELERLAARAQGTLAALRRADSTQARKAAGAGDSLDQDIRAILARFDAPTYAIPPVFRERVEYHIGVLRRDPGTPMVFRRKERLWPMIRAEFGRLGLPEDMAYVAWAESNFDPDAASDAGAKGMWQMTATTAQALGLRVDGAVDERTDPARQTRAAARHLANLLAEFGEESFMLAMASYNRGEEGVRRALRQVAAEPGGFRKDKRDFWHLYRLRKLPEETREYVPRVLAAAIVGSHPARYGLAAAPGGGTPAASAP